jgi:hypothetical protein
MAQAKAKASAKRSGGSKKSQARSRRSSNKSQKARNSSKAKTSSAPKATASKVSEATGRATSTVGDAADKATSAVGNAAGKAKLPLVAGGAALAGVAGGAALGARQARRHPHGFAKAAKGVGALGVQAGRLAADLQRDREATNGGARHRSPVEVVLEGLTARRSRG